MMSLKKQVTALLAKHSHLCGVSPWGEVCRYLFCDNLERNFNAHFLVELDSGGVVAYFLH